jgi:hypothetical protein
MKHIKLFEEYEVTNEGKLERGAAKTVVSLAALFGRFKHLFAKKDRLRLFKDIKNVKKMIDLVSYLNDSKSWMSDENLSREDIKILADNLGIDEKYPTEIDIFRARYELEFKRDLENDLDDIIEALGEEYKGKDPTTLTYFRDIKKMAEELKSVIR